MCKFLILLAALFFTGCGSKHDSVEISDNLESMNIEPIEGEAILFEDVFDNIIADECLFCHQNYSSPFTVSDNSVVILERIKGEGLGAPMPLGGPALTEEQVLLFENWVSQGMLE